MPIIGEAAEWALFFKSASQYDFYYDKATKVLTGQGTVLIWQKVVPQKDAKIKAWIEATELREVDCSRRRYKTLKGRTTYEDKAPREKGEVVWVYFEPDDLDVAFYKAACKN